MTCLQNSSYSQGTENDQMWFLYNLRYAFDHCIFAYPNASDVGLGPCSTSTACGSLQAALTDGELNADTLVQYGYCDADGSAMTGESYGKCLSCIAADHAQSYMVNFLIALEAGCLQKPAIGQVIGLNDTVFAATEIEPVDPNSIKDDDDSSPSDHRMTPQMIIGIIVGVVALLLIILAILFIRHRKRRGRMERNGKGRRPASSLSFRCQTHLSPVSSPRMFTSPETAAAQSPYTDEKSTFDGASPVSPASAWSQAYNQRYPQHHLRDPTKPSPVHAYSKNSFSEHLPEEELNSATPVSAVSAKSTQNLLPLTTVRPYVPAEYALANPYQQSPVSTQASPNLGGWSPVDRKRTPVVWGEPPAQKADRRGTRQSRMIDPLGIYTKKSSHSLNGSPVEVLELQMNFKAPPTKG